MFSPTLLNTPESFTLPDGLIELVFQSVSEMVDIPQSGTVNIAFLPDDEVQRLNCEYRGIDKNTDVLSFHYFEDFSGLEASETAGEIILSESKIVSQAAEYGNSHEAEFAKLLIHSCLHLLDYDHETDDEYVEMLDLEQKIEKIVLEKTGIEVK